MTQLDQLASLTTIVADTGDIASIAKIQPQDATTNPSLILKASKDPAYRAFLTEAVENSVSLEDAADRVLVNFGAEILKYVKGRVSTEVDARLSFDVEKTIVKARRLIELYQEKGIDKERVLIKIAATWEGVQAARVLEKRRYPLQPDAYLLRCSGRNRCQCRCHFDLAFRRQNLRLVQEKSRRRLG